MSPKFPLPRPTAAEPSSRPQAKTVTPQPPSRGRSVDATSQPAPSSALAGDFEPVSSPGPANPSKRFSLILDTCGNPDHGQSPDRALPGVPRTVLPVDSLEEARTQARVFIEQHQLGAGNLKECRIASGSTPVAELSYNLRAWDPANPNKEIHTLQPPSTRPPRIVVEVTFDDGNSLRTPINATIEEARAYYLHNTFNHGDTDAHPKDRLVHAITVEEVVCLIIPPDDGCDSFDLAISSYVDEPMQSRIHAAFKKGSIADPREAQALHEALEAAADRAEQVGDQGAAGLLERGADQLSQATTQSPHLGGAAWQ